MKALMVDDSRAMRKIIGGILRKEGFKILEAADGGKTLDLLENPESGKVDLAVIDWNMPVMNGLKLVMNVRAERNLRNIILVMMITESEHSQIVRTLAVGAHEYLIKSFTQKTINEELLLLGLGS